MTMKEIYDIALKELSTVIGKEGIDFRLEQAEFKKDEKIWEIVVSYLVDNINKSPFQLAGSLPYERVYKKVKVDEDKNVVGFYIYS